MIINSGCYCAEGAKSVRRGKIYAKRRVPVFGRDCFVALRVPRNDRQCHLCSSQ
ncbi:MAG: hypothetical protein LBL66_11415 [Clostridiales bacterium]|nr:hypothetical protein [Clostridiales bacterium]